MIYKNIYKKKYQNKIYMTIFMEIIIFMEKNIQEIIIELILTFRFVIELLFLNINMTKKTSSKLQMNIKKNKQLLKY